MTNRFPNEEKILTLSSHSCEDRFTIVEFCSDIIIWGADMCASFFFLIEAWQVYGFDVALTKEFV